MPFTHDSRCGWQDPIQGHQCTCGYIEEPMKTLDDWRTAYYEQQASHTESNGMLYAEARDLREKNAALVAYAVKKTEALKRVRELLDAPIHDDKERIHEIFKIVDAALRDENSQGDQQADVPFAPPGYRLVPVQPTHEMLLALAKLRDQQKDGGRWFKNSEAWAAMIDAAPVTGVERGPVVTEGEKRAGWITPEERMPTEGQLIAIRYGPDSDVWDAWRYAKGHGVDFSLWFPLPDPLLLEGA